MRTAPRGRMVGSLLAAAVAATSLVSAQLDGGGPGRQPAPPDIAQEWRLDNNERDTFGQAPLGDYTGLSFKDARRMRSDNTPQSVPHPVHATARPANLHGPAPASASLRATHVDWLFDRRMDRQHAEDHDYPFEGRVPPARRPADLRHVLDDGVPHAARRHPDDRYGDRRPHLPGSAVHPFDHLYRRAGREPHNGSVQWLLCRERRDRSALGTALPPWI